MFTRQKRSWMFWATCPFLLVLMVLILLLPFVSPEWDFKVTTIIILVTVEILCALVLLGFFDPLKFWWAWRGVGGIIFCGYIAYIITMLVENNGRITVGDSKSEPSVVNALLGLFAFGLPGLAYAVFSRLTFRKQRDSEDFKWNGEDQDNREDSSKSI